MKYVKGMGVVSSDGRVLGASPAGCAHTLARRVAELQRKLAEVTRERDTFAQELAVLVHPYDLAKYRGQK